MDELIKLVTFLVFFGVWILNAVNQAKKRREQELEDVFEEMDDEESFDFPQQPVERTSQPAPPPAKKSGWEDIQRELRKMLEEDHPSEDTSLPAPVREPAPSPARKQVPASPVPPRPQPVQRQSPVRESASHQAPVVVTPQPRQRKSAPVTHRPTTKRGATPRKSGHVSLPMRRGKTVRKEDKSQRRFPHLHPDPIANAIVLSEILGNPKAAIPFKRGFHGPQ